MLRDRYAKKSIVPHRVQRSRDSRVSLPWQVDPQQSIVPLGCDPFWVEARRNFDFTFKLAVVDLHGDDSDRFARGREGELLLLQGFRGFSVSPNPQTPRIDGKLNLFGIDPG